MFTTLEHLEHHIKSQKRENFLSSFGREIKGFTLFFVIVLIINSIVVNAQLYQEAIVSIVSEFTGSTDTTITAQIAWWFRSQTSSWDKIVDEEFLQKKIQLDYITQSVDAMNIVRSDDFVSEEIIKNSLQENLSSYNLDFNLLPPTDRIIIPTINLNAPLLQSSFTKNIDSITKDDFNKDLTKWVVQYPTTPKAWAGGNTLIFGHTSVESRKGNPYSTIFSKLPKLLSWDTLQIVQNGKLYEYAVIAKVIVAPDKVNAEYLKYTNGNYLTLLGCYPLWSDKQRILIIGKMKDIKN